jgi:hypothetical protein
VFEFVELPGSSDPHANRMTTIENIVVNNQILLILSLTTKGLLALEGVIEEETQSIGNLTDESDELVRFSIITAGQKSL